MFEISLPFETAWDVAGVVAFVLVFPVYHLGYPLLARWRPGRTVRGRFDLLRESWIERILERGDILAAAHQTRNLTMVSSILVSSALLLIGLAANMLVQVSDGSGGGSATETGAIRFKLYCLLLVLALAFSFFMTALRHLGNFVILIGADPELVRTQLGPPATYFAGLVNRASHRYTLGVRSFYATTPLLAWLVDARLFLGVSVLWGVKFILLQDFSPDLRAADDA